MIDIPRWVSPHDRELIERFAVFLGLASKDEQAARRYLDTFETVPDDADLERWEGEGGALAPPYLEPEPEG